MILDSLDDLNWYAVAVASVVAFVIGMAWFSPALVGGYWARHVARYSGIPEADVIRVAAQPTVLAKWLLAIATSAVALGVTVASTGAHSAVDGAAVGLTLGIGLAGTFFTWPAIFARLPWQWWLVNSGAFTVMLAAAGAILAAWQ